MQIPIRTLTVHKTRKIGTIGAIVMAENDNKTDQWVNSIIARIDHGGKDKDKVAVTVIVIVAISPVTLVVANGNSTGE